MIFVDRFVVLEQTSPASQNRFTGIIRRESNTNVWTVQTVLRVHSLLLRVVAQLNTGHLFTVSPVNLAKRFLTNMTKRNARHVKYVLKVKLFKRTAPYLQILSVTKNVATDFTLSI